MEGADVSASVASDGVARSVGHAGDMSLEASERAAIERAMASAGGNLSRAAEALGITRQSLYRRLQKFGIS